MIFAFTQVSLSQTADLYLGLTPPGYTPEVFAHGVVSLSTRNERVLTISPSGHEIFFQTGSWPTTNVQYIQYKDGVWTNPVIASFSTSRPVGEPFFSMNGNRVYYYAYQAGSTTNADIYYSQKSGETWGAPVSVGVKINSGTDAFHPCIVSDGSLYFSNGAGLVFRSQFSSGSFQNPVAIPDNVNAGDYVWYDHYVAPDESFMVFGAIKTGGAGRNDLYISFKNGDGTWTNPQNFGNTINTSADEFAPDITPDGKYMTFDRVMDNNCDIYWVAIENTIEALRATSGVMESVILTPTNGAINIFPNPSNGIINISFEKILNKKVAIEIIDINGKVISSTNYINLSDTTIDLSGNSKGIYLLKVTIDGEIINRKIVIE